MANTGQSLKVPAARKLPSGNWFIQLRLGGRSIPVTARTERECIRAAQLAKAEYKAGKRADPEPAHSPTLAEAIDRYIAARENTLSPSTIRGYRTIQKTRFKSAMAREIAKIDDWQTIVNAEAVLCGAKTLANAWHFVAAVLKYSGAAVPSVSLPQIVKNARNYLTADEIPRFLAAIHGHPHEISMLLALHSLRRSEIYALDWHDVDLKRGTIHVSGSYVLSGSGFVRRDENKTAASNRLIPIFIDRLCELLAAVPDKSGAVVRGYPGKLSDNLKRVCETAGLPAVTAHGLRHSFASLAYHLDVPERVAMRLGGWSDVTTMHNIYIHLSEKDVAAQAQNLRAFFENANENANEK